MQVVENWSHVKGRVEQWTPPEGADDHGELVVRVEQVEDVKGDAGKAYPNLLEKAEGTTLRVRVPRRGQDAGPVRRRVDCRRRPPRPRARRGVRPPREDPHRIEMMAAGPR